MISRLYGYWDIIAHHVGAILGLSLLWHMLCHIINVIIHGWIMFKDFGVLGVLISACSNSLSKHLMYGRIPPFWRRKKKCTSDKHDGIEMTPEDPKDHDTSEQCPLTSPASIYPVVVDNHLVNHPNQVPTSKTYIPQ